jgi:Tfp pilus assembly protein FimV
MGIGVHQPQGNTWQQSAELRKAAFKLPVKGVNAGINGIVSPPHPGITHPSAANPATPGEAPAVPPPPPPPSSPPQVVGGGTYTVRHGDSLWAIAHRTYGDGELWTVVYRANGAIGPDPNLVQPGQVLNLPAVARPAA